MSTVRGSPCRVLAQRRERLLLHTLLPMPKEDPLACRNRQQLPTRVKGDAGNDKVKLVLAHTLPSMDIPDTHGLVERARCQHLRVVWMELHCPGCALVPAECV